MFSNKDDEKRINETLEFLGKHTAVRHAAENKLAGFNRLEVSKAITLGFYKLGTKDTQETERRHALRGLLLCLYVSGFSGQVKAARQYYEKAGKGDLLDATKSFFPIVGAGADQVVAAALRVKPPTGQLAVHEIYKYRRGALLDGSITAGGNCYAGVAQWLYLGGVVSLGWLKDNGEMNLALGENKPKPVFNWSARATQPYQALAVPGGRILYFCRAAGHSVTVHYALSVRRGVCVGINNPGQVAEGWDWIYGNGPSRGGAYSEFRIDGYLATCQKLYRAGGGPPGEMGSKVFLQHAPCIPNNAF